MADGYPKPSGTPEPKQRPSGIATNPDALGFDQVLHSLSHGYPTPRDMNAPTYCSRRPSGIATNSAALGFDEYLPAPSHGYPTPSGTPEPWSRSRRPSGIATNSAALGFEQFLPLPSHGYPTPNGTTESRSRSRSPSGIATNHEALSLDQTKIDTEDRSEVPSEMGKSRKVLRFAEDMLDVSQDSDDEVARDDIPSNISSHDITMTIDAGGTWNQKKVSDLEDSVFESESSTEGNLTPDANGSGFSGPPSYVQESEEKGDQRVDYNEDDLKERKVEVKRWDVFREFEDDVQLYHCQKFFNIGRKLIKVLFIFLGFCAVLGGTMISKIVLLFIASNGNVYNGVREKVDSDYVLTSDASQSKCGVPVCVDYDQKADQPQRNDAVRWLWGMMLCMCTPYVLILLRNFWKISFKKKRSPTAKVLGMVTLVETVHTFGLFSFLFLVLPYIDVIRGIVLMTGVALVPGVMRIVFTAPPQKHLKRDRIVDIVACSVQFSVLLLWIILLGAGWTAFEGLEKRPMLKDVCDRYNMSALFMNATVSGNWNPTTTISSGANASSTALQKAGVLVIPALPGSAQELWAIMTPISLLLISFNWWENFIDANNEIGRGSRWLYKMHKIVRSSKTKLYLWIALWKIICSFALFLAFFSGTVGGVGQLFAYENFRNHNYINSNEFETDFLALWGIQSGCSLAVYLVGDTVVKANVQKPSYFLPLAVATPVSFGFMTWICYGCTGAWDLEKAFNVNNFWNCFSGQKSLMDDLSQWWLPVAILWWLSMVWLARHAIFSSVEKLAKTDRIFSQPMFCGVLLEQSMLFNRRRRTERTGMDAKLPTYIRDNERNTDGSKSEPDPLYNRPNDTDPYIFCCATMWHENETEMIQILKSFFRMDADQSARAKAQDHFHVKVPDFYQFEVHIFFDDAFEAHTEEERDYHVNVFVKMMVKVMNKAAMSVHKVNLEMPHPHKYETPYGGRLEYTLPGGNHMFVHMKDKMKIRHRKRWSQVMYMYYLLGHRLWGQTEPRARKELIASNTFILALDGDVDFRPDAVLLLVDLMRRNSKVGAACGRIHPIGSGVMVWYQKIEYAISHWLQKATEHVMGCVLCSPGCFSLFRGTALMDDNVMRTYTTVPTKPIHYVQYDQGEDRWLCTLLLQQGYRVEYSAAADAMTCAPEGFNEFFNQRRRWLPSTMANIQDLLKSGFKTAKKNENISILYIFYQGFQMISSMIGPGTVFLLVVSALESTLGLAQWLSFFLVFIVIAIYFVLCLTVKPSLQLMAAMILTGLLMASQMAVGVSLLLGLIQGGLCSPNSFFTYFILAVFALAAVLHPQEATDILYILVYFVFIPTMYLLLVIYALCNMNEVSWGTREVVETKTEKEIKLQKELQAEAKKAKDIPLSVLTGTKHEDGWTCSCGDCCRSMCCPRPGMSYQDKKLEELTIKLAKIDDRTVKLLASLQHTRDMHDDVDTEQEEEQIQEEDEQRHEFRKHNPDVYILATSDDERDSDHASEPLLVAAEEKAPSEEDSCYKARLYSPEESYSENSSVDLYRQGLGAPSNTYQHGDPNEVGLLNVGQDGEVGPPGDDGDSLTDPDKLLWINDPEIGNGPNRELSVVEITFWNDLIAKYLKPLDNNKVQQEKVKKQLKELRNHTVVSFFMIDVLMIVLLQVVQQAIADGPGSSMVINYNCTNPVQGDRKEYHIDVMDIVFVIVFGIIVVIQLIGMLLHRWFSLIQVVSSTKLIKPRYKKVDKMDARAAVDLVRDLQRLEMEPLAGQSDESSGSIFESYQSDSSSTVYDDNVINPVTSTAMQRGLKVTSRRYMTLNAQTLDKAFSKRFLALKKKVNETIPRDFGADVESSNGSVFTNSLPLRRTSTSVRRTNTGSLRPATEGRRRSIFQNLWSPTSSQHDDALKYVVGQKATIFTEEKERKMKERHNLDQKDILLSREGLDELISDEAVVLAFDELIKDEKEKTVRFLGVNEKEHTSSSIV